MKTQILVAVMLIGVAPVVAFSDSPSSSAARTHAECASLFMTLDKDGDGRIARSEANADPAIAIAFEKLQLGDSGSMSVDDFMDACQKPAARPHQAK